MKETIRINNEYESSIQIETEAKLIFKINCGCWNFQNKRIQTHGDFADKKFYAEPCKHLRPLVQALEKQGYELKKPKIMEGFDYCPEWLRKELLERAGHQCEAMIVNEEGNFERCSCKEQLEIHRKQRGSSGGKYNKENCEVRCYFCHRGPLGVHSNEFSGVQGK